MIMCMSMTIKSDFQNMIFVDICDIALMLNTKQHGIFYYQQGKKPRVTPFLMVAVLFWLILFVNRISEQLFCPFKIID